MKSLRWTAVALVAAGSAWASTAAADGPNVVNNTQEQPAPQPVQTAPAPAPAPAAQPVGTTQTTASPVVVANGPKQTVAEHPHDEYVGPNRTLFWSGVTMLGLSYGTAAVVGATSPLSADRQLIIPVVGPWTDLASRPSCGGQPGDRNCDEDRAAKIAIGVDGVFQALGALQIAGSFIWPERRAATTTTTTTAKAEKPKVLVTPQKVGTHGYGLGAVGTF